MIKNDTEIVLLVKTKEIFQETLFGTSSDAIYNQVARIRNRQLKNMIKLNLTAGEIIDGIEINIDDTIYWLHQIKNYDEIAEPIAILPRLEIMALYQYGKPMIWKKVINFQLIRKILENCLINIKIEEHRIRYVTHLFKAKMIFY